MSFEPALFTLVSVGLDYAFLMRLLPVVFAFGIAVAQTPQFEVVSIKPSAGNSPVHGVQPAPGGRVNITAVPVLYLVAFAYQVRENEILGAPKWFGSNQYDIVGKAETTISSPEQLRQLVQSMLADRFQFRFHNDTKELPVVRENKIRCYAASFTSPYS
jgi:hypothetical protein